MCWQVVLSQSTIRPTESQRRKFGREVASTPYEYIGYQLVADGRQRLARGTHSGQTAAIREECSRFLGRRNTRRPQGPRERSRGTSRSRRAKVVRGVPMRAAAAFGTCALLLCCESSVGWRRRREQRALRSRLLRAMSLDVLVSLVQSLHEHAIRRRI